MLTEKDYCDYDTCVALKELGYNEKCHGYYEPLKNCLNTTSIKHGWRNSEVNDIGVIICPTLYEAQKWLREEKKIIVDVNFNLMYKEQPRFSWRVLYNLTQHKGSYYTFDSVKPKEDYDSFEEALSEGIKEAIKILKEK